MWFLLLVLLALVFLPLPSGFGWTERETVLFTGGHLGSEGNTVSTPQEFTFMVKGPLNECEVVLDNGGTIKLGITMEQDRVLDLDISGVWTSFCWSVYWTSGRLWMDGCTVNQKKQWERRKLDSTSSSVEFKFIHSMDNWPCLTILTHLSRFSLSSFGQLSVWSSKKCPSYCPPVMR